MESESERLASFVNLPLSSTLTRGVISRLSCSGFYYSGHDEVVICFRCRREFSGWPSVDDLLKQHRPMNCRLEKPHNGQPTAATDRQTSESRATSATSNHQPTWDQAYTEFSSKVESYRGHPYGGGASTRRLAKGPKDNVHHFGCNGEQRDWQPTNNPGTEQARRLPRCAFATTLVTDDVPVVASREQSKNRVVVAHPDDVKFADDPSDAEEQMESKICQTPDINQNVQANVPSSLDDTDDDACDNLSDGILSLHENDDIDINLAEHNVSNEVPEAPIVFMSNGVEMLSLHDDDSVFMPNGVEMLSLHEDNSSSADNDNIINELPEAPIVFMSNGVLMLSLHDDDSTSADNDNGAYGDLSDGILSLREDIDDVDTNPDNGAYDDLSNGILSLREDIDDVDTNPGE